MIPLTVALLMVPASHLYVAPNSTMRLVLWARPDGLVTLKINEETGQAATDADANAVFEIFRKEKVPTSGAASPAETTENGNDAAAIPEQLF